MTSYNVFISIYKVYFMDKLTLNWFRSFLLQKVFATNVVKNELS